MMTGDGTDRVVTVNDLTSAGIASTDSSGRIKPSTGSTAVGTPPAPVNVVASAAVRNIIVSWDAPRYSGHAYAEIWGASSDNIGAAVKIGMAPGSMFVDAIGPSSTRYYWVRFVNILDVIGAYNAVSGTLGITGPEVSYLLEQLAGSVTESQLASDLNTRISLIDAPASVSGSVAYQFALVQGQIDAINAYPDYDNATTYATNDIVKYNNGIYKAKSTTAGNLPTDTVYWLKIGDYTSLADAVASHTAEIATLVTDLGSEVNSRTTLAAQMRGEYTGTDLASITSGLLHSEAIARASADEGLAGQISTVSATASGKNTIYRQATAPEEPAVNDIWVDTKISYSTDYFAADFSVPKYKQYQWNGSAWIDITDSDISDNYGLISKEQIARAARDSALAQDITTLDAKVTTNDVALRATLVSDYLTSAATNSAIAQSKTSLRAYADFNSKTFRQTSAPTTRGVDPDTSETIALQVGDIWVDTDDGNHQYQWGGSAWVDARDGEIAAVDGRVGEVAEDVTTVSSAVTTIETSKIGYSTKADGTVFDNGGVIVDKAAMLAWNTANPTDLLTWNVGLPLAQVVKQVSISDGETSATLETRLTAQKAVNDNLQAEYYVKLDVDGNVAGYGLLADETTSEFIVNVDRFAVTSPESSIPLWNSKSIYAVGEIARIAGINDKTLVCKVAGTRDSTAPTLGAIGTRITDGTIVWQVASRVPFSVQAVPDTVNGVTLPAGVYVDAAYILNATIQTAQIADEAVDDSKIASVNVDKLTAGTIDVDTYIQSTLFESGDEGVGFRINGDGSAEFNEVTVRGTVYATDGQFNGTVLGGDATAFDTGTGFFSGYAGTTYKWRVGAPDGNRVEWDGANLNIVPSISVTSASIQDALVSGAITFELDEYNFIKIDGPNQRIDVYGGNSITGAKLRVRLGKL
jgi:hypothetical protein